MDECKALIHGSNPGVEKEDSHAGKVIHRSWYEKNKHIFPASRWEQWDPLKVGRCRLTL
jgi:protein FAM50